MKYEINFLKNFTLEKLFHSLTRDSTDEIIMAMNEKFLKLFFHLDARRGKLYDRKF